MTATARTIELVQAAAKAADGVMGTDLVGLDVSERLPLTDAFLLATGSSERQVSAIARAIEDDLFELGAKPLRREGRADGRWVLIDLGDLVVHVFHEDERQYYQLERLWRDCPAIALDLPAAD
ncbi:ribosome silencing factor [Agrococcus jejuensis]|uniref:Ribosomal silencing factor RsfS n=1 Tax=Agrococcus jejuensis TaxID=399736 RepID=A0A1G8GW81_9MICO|nr:ribosome silencing factor [Agrococcus jejuensis]SDH98655.1 ribosome-associated protein [Agrococcus jejuensis]